MDLKTQATGLKFILTGCLSFLYIVCVIFANGVWLFKQRVLVREFVLPALYFS